MTKPGYDRKARAAVERLDVLESPEDLPGSCAAAGCVREGRYAWAGRWGTRPLCARHIVIYRQHARIMERIRAIC